MDQYLEKIEEKNNLIDKILKMQKNLLKVQIIFLLIILYLLIFKNILILKLIFLVLMFTISIISAILAGEAKILRDEVLELTRELNNEKAKKIKNELLELLKKLESMEREKNDR